MHNANSQCASVYLHTFLPRTFFRHAQLARSSFLPSSLLRLPRTFLPENLSRLAHSVLLVRLNAVIGTCSWRSGYSVSEKQRASSFWFVSARRVAGMLLLGEHQERVAGFEQSSMLCTFSADT